MALTWRDVAPASAGAANDLLGSGQTSVLQGIKALKDMLIGKQDKQNTDMLGKLQAGVAAEGASKNLQDILYQGAEGLDGKALAALSQSVVNQGKNMFDQGLEKNKFDTAQSNFLKEIGLREQDLGLKEQSVQQDASKIELDRAKMNQQGEQFNANLGLDREKFNSDSKYRGEQIKLQQDEIQAKIGSGKMDTLRQAELTKLLESDEFKALPEDQKYSQLAIYAKDAGDAASILSKTPDKVNDNKSLTSSYKAATDRLMSPEFELTPDDKSRVAAVLVEGEKRKVPAHVLESYIVDKSDAGSWTGNLVVGNNVDFVRNIDWEEVTKYGNKQGLDTGSAQNTASANEAKKRAGFTTK